MFLWVSLPRCKEDPGVGTESFVRFASLSTESLTLPRSPLVLVSCQPIPPNTSPSWFVDFFPRCNCQSCLPVNPLQLLEKFPTIQLTTFREMWRAPRVGSWIPRSGSSTPYSRGPPRLTELTSPTVAAGWKIICSFCLKHVLCDLSDNDNHRRHSESWGQ